MPEPSRAARPAPLIVGFHGRGETPASFSAASGLSAAPAVVAYPRGVTTEDGVTDWQGSPWAARGVDDVGFTRGLVHRLEHDLCIDRDRVYAVGHSDGGNLAAQVACALPHRIAAVATYGGAFYGQDAICGRRPTAVLEMHSVDDPVVPYDGLRLPMTTLAPVPELVRAQAAVNGCRPRHRRSALNGLVTRFVFTGCAHGEPLVHIRVRDTNHAVPDPRALGGLRFAGLVWGFLRDQRTAH